MTLRSKLGWISVLYFAEGFPFGIVKDVLPVYLRVHGVDLAQIGYLSLASLPWALKVLWSPLIDRFGERRQWIFFCLVALAILSALMPYFDARVAPVAFWIVLLAFTCASATQDMAIDSYTIGILEPGEEGDANGVRASAYRVALIVGGGILVALSPWLGWAGVFRVAAVVFALLAVATRYTPAQPLAASEPGVGAFAAIEVWASRRGAWAVVLFVLIYKLGDAAMGPMVKPFWVDRGLGVEEIGLVSTSAGVAAAVIGALLGGHFTSRYGIVRGLWVLGLAQALSNIGYAAVAWLDPPVPTPMSFSSLGHFLASTGAAVAEPGRGLVWAASIFESFTGGLGTAAFLSFLMHICEKRHAAVQYALLSAIFALSRDLAGAASGLATTRLGYGAYFMLTFALALPSLALIPILRGWISERAGGTKSDER
jgi:PAT family beta-lactamase induction signal transducer AmpG